MESCSSSKFGTKMDYVCGKAQKEMWKRLYKQLKNENEEVLKLNLEMECDLDAKRMKIAELEANLEGKIEVSDDHEDPDGQLNATELLHDDDLKDVINELLVMGSSSSEESNGSDSEINRHEEKSYELLTTSISKGKGQNGTLRCPFCDNKEDYNYDDLLQHATGVAEGSTIPSAELKANHLALAEYLETYLSHSALLQGVSASVARTGKNELFYWPWVGIIAYRLKDPKEVNYVLSCEYWQKKLSKFKPLEIETIWDYQRDTLHAVVRFDHDWTGFKNAMEFEKFFEAGGRSKKEWDDHRTSPGSYIYGWFAREDDYTSPGLVGNYLRRGGGLKAISDLVLESTTDRHKMVVNLINEIDLKSKTLDHLQLKYDKMKMSLSRIRDERDEVYNAFCEETRKKQLNTLEHIKSISEQQDILILELGSNIKISKKLSKRVALTERERLKVEVEKTKNNLRNEALQMACKERRKTSDKVQRLVEEQKREKEEAFKKILELERNLEEKQKLEMEIQDLNVKLDVMKHLAGDDDAAVQQKLDEMKEQLEQKHEDLEGLDHVNQQLLAKERHSNDELQDARKELIAGLSDLLSSNRVHIGIKRMGELDEKPFKNACNMRFSPEEAEIKAAELCSLWQETMKNPEWYPFQIVEDENGNYQRLVREDDERLRGLKKEWGDEVYEAVTSALIHLLDYNPSRCFPVPELWNFKENQEATLKEVIHYIFMQLKSLKRKRN